MLTKNSLSDNESDSGYDPSLLSSKQYGSLQSLDRLHQQVEGHDRDTEVDWLYSPSWKARQSKGSEKFTGYTALHRRLDSLKDLKVDGYTALSQKARQSKGSEKLTGYTALSQKARQSKGSENLTGYTALSQKARQSKGSEKLMAIQPFMEG
ncbi:unnamed protein product [Mytilus edulis]|uniref:Uncharacterized protein n=1 Tax=Mytilus edulis TaxID=6550 RepID=A0A8S3VGU9_MYTED|nr:unnamed protein product [Mytilus edulis]